MECWILGREAESRYSIKQFNKAGIKHNINIKILDVDSISSFPTDDFPDFMLTRMGAETDQFTLAMIRDIENRLPTFNSARSIELSKDKFRTYQLLTAHNIPTPKSVLIKCPVDFNYIKSKIGYPLVIKTLSGSQGHGVLLCHTQDELAEIINFLETSKSCQVLIVQEFIKESHGRDVRVFTVGDEIIAGIQRVASPGNFRANFSLGGTVTPIEITSEIRELTSCVTKLFGLDISGIDLLYTKHGYTICEANSSPGFKGLESCCDVDVADAIFNYIKSKLV